MAILAGVTLVRGAADRPSVVVGAMVLGFLWAAFATLVAYPDHALSRNMLIVDVVVGVASLLAPNAAGTEVSFFGGLPLIVVALAALQGRTSGLIAANTLIVATLVALQALSFPAIVGETTLIFAYIGVGILVAWIGDVLRTAEARLVEASEAVGRANTAAARAAERADIGRHLHDSVLQTLALIQRDSRDPQKVTIQARRQERELRDWLFGPPESPRAGLDDGLRAAAAAIEERFEVSVDVVVVGDAPHSDSVAGIVAAAGEAMTNAARHAAVTELDVYGEVADGVIRVYVRDRGVGFDVEAVPSDRHGVRSSIVSRVESLGGAASVKSVDGAGTEWRLTIPMERENDDGK
jgi:signal transduction histidine kinase